MVDYRRRDIEAARARGEPVAVIGPALGFRDLKWLKPVRPGDTIRAQRTTLEVRASANRPEMGLVKTRWEVFNQNGEQVMTMEGYGMFRRRNPGSVAK